MYLQCLLICHGHSFAEEEAAKLFKQKNINNLNELRATQSSSKEIFYRRDLVDSKLTPNSFTNLFKSKPIVDQHPCDTIIVSPLAKTLQTCLHLYDYAGVQIFIDPLLTEQVVWSAAIPRHTQQLIKEFKQARIEWVSGADRKWFIPHRVNLAQSGQISQQREQLDNCLGILRKNNQIENREAFLARVENFRSNLLMYNAQTKKKIAIITHKDVLEALTATGLHQDLKLINKVNFQKGDIKSEFIFIDGVESQPNQTIPFCS